MSTTRTLVPEYPYCLLSICLSVCPSVRTSVCLFPSYSFKLSFDSPNTCYGTVKGHGQIFDGYKMTVRSRTEVKFQNSNVVLENTVRHLLFPLVIITFHGYFALVNPECGLQEFHTEPLESFRGSSSV